MGVESCKHCAINDLYSNDVRSSNVWDIDFYENSARIVVQIIYYLIDVHVMLIRVNNVR